MISQIIFGKSYKLRHPGCVVFFNFLFLSHFLVHMFSSVHSSPKHSVCVLRLIWEIQLNTRKSTGKIGLCIKTLRS
jgi:hypothetical protein